MSDHDVVHDPRGARFGTAWLRFCAVVVDFVVVLPLMLLPWWLGPRIHSSGLMMALWSAQAACFISYTVLLHGLRGQTIGKMLLKVKVLDVGETPLSMRQAVLRDSPTILISLVYAPWVFAFTRAGGNPFRLDLDPLAPFVLEYLGPAWILADGVALLASSKRRALHDLIARSVVVRTEAATADSRSESPHA